MSAPLNPNLPANLPPIGPRRVVYLQATRPPTVLDSKYRNGSFYEFDTEWRDTSASPPDIWKLVTILSKTNAIWVKLNSGSSGPLLQVTVPSGVSPIVPDGVGVMNFTSSLGTITITGSAASPNNHTINFDLAGGSLGIDSVQVQTAVPPGVNPVVPDGVGLLTFSANVIAQSGTPLQTITRAVNTILVELQIATTGASTTASLNGVSHFYSGQFSVDANGFVQLVGGSAPALQKINVDANTGPGTDPVVPDGSGQIIMTGAQVASGVIGANVIRTDSLAANTVTIEIQRSNIAAATDSTLNGVSHFDSARFTIDANGFVGINGSGVGETITGDSGGALNPTAGNWNILGRSGSKTSGSGSTLTVNSPPYADQAAPTTVTLNSGSFATAAITLTTPASAGLLDGDKLEFVATNGVLIIQLAATQVAHLGSASTSVAGTITGTATGDSISLRYQTSTNDWWATSSIGIWILA